MRKVKYFLLLFLLIASQALGADWYASTDGSANCASGCLTGAPCSLATVLTCSVIGDDNVILKDGTYTGSLTVPWSGTEGHPITIKAENPWGAIIDGQGSNNPLYISNQSYVDIEDIIFKNAISDVVKIYGTSGTASHINLRRLAAINAGTGSGANYHIFLLWGTGVSYVLIEDCYASQGSYTGGGRHGIVLYNGPHHNTIRRNYILYYKNQSVGNPGCSGISIYGAGDYNIIENNVMNFSIGDTTNCSLSYKAISIVSQTGNSAAPDYTKIYGNIGFASSSSPKFSEFIDMGIDSGSTHYLSNTEIKDNVFLYAQTDGIMAYSANDVLTQNNTLINVSNGTTGMIANYTCCQSIPTIGTTKNNSLLTTSGKGLNSYGTSSTMASTYNNFYGISTIYTGTITDKTGDKTLNPSYDTTTYGKGAYLMVPTALIGQGEASGDIGAKVLYRYVDGVLTGMALWPWPMEQRICNETGYSVTYESGYSGCSNGGGIWETLGGVYEGEPPVPGSMTLGSGTGSITLGSGTGSITLGSP